MTATDELRRLLDERGIEYEPIDSVHSPNRRTLWGKVERGKGILGLDAKYETIEFKKGMRLTISDCSPAQAVEATLGRGTCEVVRSIRHDYEGGYGGTEYEHELSCGHKTWWADDDPPEWCPHCGRKVVDA